MANFIEERAAGAWYFRTPTTEGGPYTTFEEALFHFGEDPARMSGYTRVALPGCAHTLARGTFCPTCGAITNYPNGEIPA